MIMTVTRPLHAWMRSRTPLRGSKGGQTIIQPPAQPAPTPAQDQALNTQTDILKQQLALAQQQQAYGNAIAPLQLMQSGYTPQEVAADYQAKQGETVIPIGGKNYMISQDPNAKALADVNQQVALASGQRTLAALNGTLPVDPAVDNDITRGRQELMEELRNRLGPGFETSDPGMRALSEYDRNATNLKYQVRTGQLSAANAISLNTQGQQNRQTSQFLGQIKDAFTPIAQANQAYGGAAALAGNIYGGQLQNSQYQQGLAMQGIGMGMQKDMANSQNMSGLMSGGMGLAGGIGGALIL